MTKTKREVAKGFVWHSVERFGNTAFQTLVSLLLARMLTPADFGLVSMLVVFSLIAQSIADSGMTQALLRKKEPTQRDYTSAFYFNIILSAAIYVIMVAVSPLIARFYDEPLLTQIAPVLFASIPISALGFVQYTYLMKTMNFKTSSKIVLLASLLSGAAALVVAWSGYGLWAIVTQIVVRDILRVVFLWLWHSWKPTGWIDRESFRSMFGFGSNLMLTGVIGQLSTNVSQMFIGRIYNPTMLGLYYQSQKLRDTVVFTLIGAVQNVTYPAMARLQDDEAKLRDAARKVIIVISFILFPILAGLILTANELFALVLTDKWIEAAPYFVILCVSSFFNPVQAIAYNILRVRGRGQLILKIEIARQILMFALLFATVYISVMAVALAMIFYSAVGVAVYAWYAKREVVYRLRDMFFDSLPYLAMCAAMAVGVTGVGYLCAGVGLLWLTVVKVVTGAAIYIALAIVFRVEAWVETVELLSKKHKEVDMADELVPTEVNEG